MDKKVLEIVTFQAGSSITPEAMLAASSGIKPWLSAQPGFIRRSLAMTDDGRWIDCVTWSNMECANAAAAGMPAAPGAGAFMSAIAMESVVMKHYQIEDEM